MVLAAEEQVMDALGAALEGRTTFSIGVARQELLVDGELHDSKGSVPRDLALRLHKRGVGALVFERGVTIEELRTALSWIAVEPDGGNDVAPTLSRVHITRIDYEHLVIDDAMRDAEFAVASLWRTLAELAESGSAAGRAADHHRTVGRSTPELGPSDVGASDQPRRDAAPTGAFVDASGTDATGYDTDAIIASLKGLLHQSPIARRTAVAMMELSGNTAAADPNGGALIGEQLQSLIDRLGASSVTPIVQSLGNAGESRRFITQISDVLPIDAAVSWIETAASAKQQELSHSMIRLMTKLSTLAVTRGDVATTTDFRETARSLVSGWELDDPNPEHHKALLEQIASFERTTTKVKKPSRRDAVDRSSVESKRLVQMALEMDCAGEDTTAATEALVGEGAGQQVMQWVRAAGDTTTARWVRDATTSPRAVRQLLLSEPVDRLEARALLEILEPSAADTLLDVLAESTTRGTRLIVRQRLAEFGDAITPQLIARLDDAPWFVIRNILTLLFEFVARNPTSGAVPDQITPLLTHPQVQVRIEALRILVALDATTRDTALRVALRDENERVVVVAVQALTDAGDAGARLPSHFVSQLMALVDAGAHSDSVRARIVRTLAFTHTNEVRDWLVRRFAKRTPILRRLVLVEPSQTAVSALQVLVRIYKGDTAAASALRLARGVGSDPRWQLRDTSSSVERFT